MVQQFIHQYNLDLSVKHLEIENITDLNTLTRPKHINNLLCQRILTLKVIGNNLL